MNQYGEPKNIHEFLSAKFVMIHANVNSINNTLYNVENKKKITKTTEVY